MATKMVAKIAPKATKNHQKLKFAFWERFGTSKRGAPEVATAHFGAILGAIFGKTRKKKHPKVCAKIDAEKVMENDAKGAKSDAKSYQKWIPKSTFCRNGDFLKTIVFPLEKPAF